ncbi:MAG TPA: hypothetical protein VD970_12865, partial [Acetobacteraceae bacterium]|nr:hypothetical protein [Acetobacteraceae bacterium]
MAGAFLYDDRVRGAAALSAPLATIPSMPISNQLDPQPRMRTRFPGTAAAVLVDFGAETEVDCVALISTTLGPSATARWRLGPAEAVAEAAAALDLDLVPGWTPPLGSSFARSGGQSFAFSASGVLTQYAAHQPRPAYDPVTLDYRGVLFEPASTNEVRNPRAEGAVAGTPGMLPTHWSSGGGQDGVNLFHQVVGTGTEDGIPYIDLRLFGTVPAGGGYLWVFPAGGAYTITAAPGEVWSAGVYARLVGGSLAGIAGSLRTQIDFRDAANDYPPGGKTQN